MESVHRCLKLLVGILQAHVLQFYYFELISEVFGGRIEAGVVCGWTGVCCEWSYNMILCFSLCLLPEFIRHAGDDHRSRRGQVPHHRQLHSVWALPLLQGNSGFPSCRRLVGTVMKASTTLTLMCFDAGIFSRVHQPAAVGLLLRPGRAGSVSHYEVKRRTDGCVVKYNEFTDVVVMFTFFLFLSLSPLMSRIFPESFPNKQYQLLFTQGSGESKEGETCCNTPVFTKRSKDQCVIMWTQTGHEVEHSLVCSL